MRYTWSMPDFHYTTSTLAIPAPGSRGLAAMGLMLMALLGGCASAPEAPQTSSPVVVDTTEPEQGLSTDDLLQRAARANTPEAAVYLLQAASLQWMAGDLEGAKETLGFIETEGLNNELMAGILLLQAELATASKLPEQVIALLQSNNFPTLQMLAPEQQIRYHELHAQAQYDTGAVLPSALERIQLDRLLDASAQINNHEQIWQALATLPQAQLAVLSTTAINFEVQGWYQLALVGRAYSNDLDRQLMALQKWRSDWVRHPAASVLPRELELAETMARERPQQLALLLPLATPAGIIVRDAFMSAYFHLQEIGGQVPAVRFYDTGNASDIRALHLQARLDGADMIIGPLLKQQVAVLQSEIDLGVPTLALNNVEGPAPASPQLYQFALSPEDEAAQLANKAWSDGHRRAAILSPFDDIGNDTFARKRDSFIAQWQRLGGDIVAQDSYRDNYTQTISGMLELSASSARMEDVRELVNQPLVFEQRRRQDIDFIYLVAQPGPARQIVPNLSYLYAGDIPVYASQDIYSGLPLPLQDRDINGVTFGDSPWLLGSALIDAGRTRELFPMNTAQNLRLQAFGMDAFRLYPRLRLLESSAESQIPGATGMLTLGPNRTIVRELTWATITEGLAKSATQ